MQPVLGVFFMLLFVLLCLLGIAANSFIVLALGGEWRRRGRLLPADLVLLSLGCSRFGLQWVGLANNLYYALHLGQYSRGPARQLFGLHWDFLNTATFWLGAWLSVLFCAKIASFGHPAFLWLKWRLPASVPWLLLSSLAMSTVVTLLFFWGNHAMYHGFLMGEFSGNRSYREWSHRLEIHYFLPLKLATLSVPCSLFLASMALLISSLRRHVRRMRPRAARPQDPQDPRAQAHVRALKALVSFLTLYALSFVSLIIDAVGLFTSESDWYWPWQILIYLCTSLHPFILILGNLKLRGACRQLLLLARGFWEA
ncbi:PREDICTED: taste receptor type 2 member 41-like [Elephantulus edwardii]|uniref:taste receptor type 2 member 41-like n=1 Tax=Elephantulus edwardii TaxID=28737 RepID=UPI0003F0C280|nr:PREDICTED: taste receptor type 2 member 41-like [Elephantulus edwardii]